MSPCSPSRTLRINVPRHNAQRLGPSLTNEVRNAARQKKIRVQLHPPVEEQSGGMSSCMESASEWNSLLTTARAERGPQWDVATQQFFVEKESQLYYNPTPLLQATRSTSADGDGSGPSQYSNSLQSTEYGAAPMLSPAQHRQSYHSQLPPYPSMNYSGRITNSPVGHHPNSTHTHTPNRRDIQLYGNNYGMSGGQYYSEMQTPTKTGGGGMQDGTVRGMSPDVRRRVTRAMAEESPGMYGS